MTLPPKARPGVYRLSYTMSITKDQTDVTINNRNGLGSLGSDEDDPGSDNNPFRSPEVAERWRTKYEEAQYECRHVFDPTLTWSAEEEKKIIRKLDWHVCLWAVRQPLPMAESHQTLD